MPCQVGPRRIGISTTRGSCSAMNPRTTGQWSAEEALRLPVDERQLDCDRAERPFRRAERMIDVLARDLVVRYQAQAPAAGITDSDTAVAEAGDESIWIDLIVEGQHDDICLDGLDVDGQTGEPVEALGEALRVGMVVG